MNYFSVYTLKLSSVYTLNLRLVLAAVRTRERARPGEDQAGALTGGGLAGGRGVRIGVLGV